jgi:hypothetical protein
MSDVFDLRRHPQTLLAILVAMFVVATGVRLMRLDAPGVLVDRDYTSAMFARAWYFADRADVPEWRREMAQKQMERQPTLEPPLTEWVASIAYRVAGRDDIRLGRLVTIAFWLGGGVLLFLLARRLVEDEAALVALAYYLFAPAAVLLSRSFQADSLMMLLFIASLLGIVRHHQASDRFAFVVAALVSAVTLLYRPLVMPAVVLAFVLPVVQAQGWRRGILGSPTIAFVAIATLPAFAYYGYGAFVAQTFGWKLTTSFMPSLWGHVEYWREWFLIAGTQLGVTPLFLAILGMAFVPAGLPRTLLVALGLGYLCFGLAFTYHISTHGYYQAQLIPAVAIAAAPLVVHLVRQASATPWLRVAPIAAAVLIAGTWWHDIRQALAREPFESPDVARTIGGHVEHSDRVVFLAPFYGLPLQYLGEFTGAYWPRSIQYALYRQEGDRERSVRERVEAMGFVPEYFVITHFREYAANHDDLRQYLESRCTPVALTDAYLIYGRCQAP